MIEATINARDLDNVADRAIQKAREVCHDSEFQSWSSAWLGAFDRTVEGASHLNAKMWARMVTAVASEGKKAAAGLVAAHAASACALEVARWRKQPTMTGAFRAGSLAVRVVEVVEGKA